MPVYVYRNLVSGETFEVQQRMTDDALTVDPRTGDPVRRVIQPVGIAFKGSGFYVNDSRGSSSAKQDKPAATPAAGSDAAKPTATDTGANAGGSPAAPAATGTSSSSNNSSTGSTTSSSSASSD